MPRVVRKKHHRLIERLRSGRELHSLVEIMPQTYVMTRRRRMLLARAAELVAKAKRVIARKESESMRPLRESAFKAFARLAVDPTQTLTEGVVSSLRESMRRPIKGQSLQKAVLADLGEAGGGAATHGGGDARDGRPALRRTPKGAVTKSGGSVDVKGEVTSSKPLPWDDATQQQPLDHVAVGGVPRAGESEAFVTMKKQPQDWRSKEAAAANSYGQLLRNESPLGGGDGDGVWDDESPEAVAIQDKANRLAGQMDEGEDEDDDMQPTGYDWLSDGDVAGGLKHTIRDGVLTARLTDDADARQNILDAVRALGQVHQDLTGEPGLDEDELELYMSEDEDEPERARIRGDEDEAGRGRRMRGSEDEIGDVSSTRTYAAKGGREGSSPVHRASGMERAVLGSLRSFERSTRSSF